MANNVVIKSTKDSIKRLPTDVQWAIGKIIEGYQSDKHGRLEFILEAGKVVHLNDNTMEKPPKRT